MNKMIMFFAAFVFSAGFMSPVITLASPAEEQDSISVAEEEQELRELISELTCKAADEVWEAAESVKPEEDDVRQGLVSYALQFVGCRYQAGGNDPHTGADCSGFVKYVMQYGAGVTMNRSSAAQSVQGVGVSAEDMQPGDLIFYSRGAGIDHVAMYIGNGQIVHAATSKTGITVSPWNYRAPARIMNVLS